MYNLNIHINWWTGEPIMEASVVDLRYRMKDILAALERREEIRILYHGRVKGILRPVSKPRKIDLTDHPFFGMGQSDSATVPAIMEGLRKGRYDAL
jgi:hypothetical protein